MNARRVASASAAVLALSAGATARAQNVDIVTQEVGIDISGPGTTIVLDVTLEATGAASFLDLLSPGMTIDSFTVDGTLVEPAPHPQYPEMALRVAYPATITSGQIVKLGIQMSGTPTCDASTPPGTIVCKRTPEETFFTPVMPNAAWYLYNLYDQDSFTGSIAVTAPATHAVVAGHGAAIDVVEGPPGTKTWTFPVDQPTELMGVYASVADFAQSESGASVEAYYHVAASEPDLVEHAVDLTSQLIPVYEALYGELPAVPARIVTVPKNFFAGGIGLLGLVFVGEYIFGTHEYLLEQGMAHEFAHSWWGGLASSGNQVEGGFLSEAFAEYSAWRALGELQGDDARTSGVRMSAVWYMYRRPGDEDIAVLSANVQDSPLYVFVTYHKGSVALRTLAEAVGEEAFTDALRTFIARGYGGLSVDALVEDVAAITGYDAAADVQQWLHETGFPRLSVKSSIGDGVDLAVGCEGPCALSAPVRLTFADGTTETQVLSIAPGETDHHLASAERPVAVEIDPRWTLVREVNPAVSADVTLDGAVDVADLIDVALHAGGVLPDERRRDGRYDPLRDPNRDRAIDDADLDMIVAAIPPLP